MEVFARTSIDDFEAYEYKESREGDGGTTFARGSRTQLSMRLKAKNSYSFPSDSFIQLNYFIDQEDTPDAPVVGAVAPVNNGFAAFEKARYILSTNTIEDIDKPGLTTLVKGLLNYSDDYSRAQGMQEGWYPDTGSGVADEGQIWVRNISDTTLLDYPLSLAVELGNTHAVSINSGAATGYAAGHIIELYVFKDGKKVTLVPYVQAIATSFETPIVLQSQGVTGALIDYIGVIVADSKIGLRMDGEDITFRGIRADGSNGGYGILHTDATNVVFATALPLDAAASPMVIVDNEIIDNEGWKRRRELGISTERTSDNGYSLWLPARLLFPYLKQNPMLTFGMDQEINVDMNNVTDFLHRSVATEPCNIKMTKLSWWVPIVKPGLLFKSEFNKILNSGKKRVIEWVSNSYQVSPNFTQDGEQSWTVKTSNKKPIKVYVFFQFKAARNNQTQNPMVFDHLNLRKIQLEINSSRNYPENEYRVSYAKGKTQDYSRVYNAYLSGCNALHSPDCVPAVSYEAFKELYPLYVFDLRAQDENVWESTTSTEIAVKYSLDSDATLANGYNVHVIIDHVRKTTIETINGKMTNIQ